MQNKGLVLSMADVQALRNAGFTPKGTVMQGSKGFDEGGYVQDLLSRYQPAGQSRFRGDDDDDRIKSIRRIEEDLQEELNFRPLSGGRLRNLEEEDVEEYNRKLAEYKRRLSEALGVKQQPKGFFGQNYTGTSSTPYTGPMSGGPMSGNPNAQPPAPEQLGAGQEVVFGPDGWMIRENKQATSTAPTPQPMRATGIQAAQTQPEQQPQAMQQRDMLLGTAGTQSFNQAQQTLTGATPQPQSEVTPAATTEQPDTQREMLLGGQGASSFEQSQQMLQQQTPVTPAPATTPEPMQAAPLQTAPEPAPAPVEPTPAAPTPAAPTPAAPTPVAPTPEAAQPAFPTPEQPVVAPPAAATTDGTAQAQVSQVEAPAAPDLAKAEAVLASDEVKAYLDQVRAAQGEVTANNLVNAAIQDPNSLAQLQMEAAQISEAQRVEPVADRAVQEGEMISGPAVEQAKVDQLVADIKAQTAEPSELATVQGQLAKLTADFDTKKPPAWAAGALRNATAQLAARGLAASSMAGQALIQATFEAATPIAAADAATLAQFEQQNLSNRQQATLLAAQQRAEFLGQEFDQAFQAKVTNAARISEIANMNFNADVQIALENARLAQSVDIANLNAANAKVLADAAAMSNMELANLNNRQQANVANAKAFLDMDLANLNNEQQTTLLKSQAITNAMMSDQAATNAAINLNTTNENQLNQFFTQLEANVAQFNVAQSNAIAQSNVSELNAMVKFNEEQENNLKISYDRNQAAISAARISADASVRSSELSASATRAAAEASAAASRAAAQARADADRAIAAAANEAKITLTEMEQQYQREADILAMNYDTMTSNADKAFELVKLDLSGQIELEAAQFAIDAKEDAQMKKDLTDLAVGVVTGLNPFK